MLCGAELSGWGGRILESLGDTTSSTGSVVSWLRNNLFRLNIALEEDFSNSGECVVPEMSMPISGIYEEMYYCDYLRKKSTSLLGGVTFQDVVEIRGEEQGTIRFSSFSERAKTLRTAAQDCNTSLKNLIDWYLSFYSRSAYALQILYNLRDDPAGYGLQYYCPPPDYYSRYNTVFTSVTPY